MAGSGFITSNAALAVIYVGTLGSVIHVVEGLTMLAAGVAATRAKEA